MKILGLFLLLMTSQPAKAQEIDPAAIRGEGRQRQVSILQNRHFLKAWRPELGIQTGSMLNEAYTDTDSYGWRVALFPNEWLGFEFQQNNNKVRKSTDRKALDQLEYLPLPESGKDPDTRVKVEPEVNGIQQTRDFSTLLAPFYGKLNLLNYLFVYTDVYVSLGISQLKTDQGDLSAIHFGLGQRLYIAKNWSIRLDFKNRSFTEKRNGKDSQKNARSIDIGASYFFF